MSDHQATSINAEVQTAVDPETNILTGGYKEYSSLKKVVVRNKSMICTTAEASKLLPRAHTSLANAKRVLLCGYHRINGDYLQNYLDEFLLTLNRRSMAKIMFQRLLLAASA